MMGAGHALLGTAVWAVGATTVLPLVGLETTPEMVVLGAFPVAGAALRPDIDHPQASIANSAGPITRAVARGANALSGGHRQGTHRLPYLGLCVAFDLAIVAFLGTAGALGLFFLYTAFGAQALVKTEIYAHVRRAWARRMGPFAILWCWAVAAAVTWLAWRLLADGPSGPWWWLPVALTMGHLTHLLGDCLTTGGLSLVRGRRIGLPILGNAGSWRERAFTAVLGAVTTVMLLDAAAQTEAAALLGQLQHAVGQS